MANPGRLPVEPRGQPVGRLARRVEPQAVRVGRRALAVEPRDRMVEQWA